MKFLLAIIAFVVGFAGVFWGLGMVFAAPFPAMAEIPNRISKPEFWTSNWQGALGGLLVGVVLAFLAMKRKPKRAEK